MTRQSVRRALLGVVVGALLAAGLTVVVLAVSPAPAAPVAAPAAPVPTLRVDGPAGATASVVWQDTDGGHRPEVVTLPYSAAVPDGGDIVSVGVVDGPDGIVRCEITTGAGLADADSGVVGGASAGTVFCRVPR